MKPRSDPKKPEQLHNESAAAEQTFSLDEIMREFGGWSDWSQKPGAWPQDEPSPEPKAVSEPEAPEGLEQAEAPQAAAAEPAAQLPPDPEELKTQVPAAAPKPDVSGDTIRFDPVPKQDEPDQRRRIWSYKGEPPPDGGSGADAAPYDAKRAKRELRARARLLRKQERRKRIEARRREVPDHVYDSPEQAFQAYNKPGTLRLRLFLSLILTLASAGLLLLCSGVLPGFDLSAMTRLVSIVLLALMLLQALLSPEPLVRGFRSARLLRFDHLSLLLLLVLLSTADSAAAIWKGRLPFCPVVSLQLLLALWGESLLLDGKRRSAKAACSMPECFAAVREEKAWHGKDCIFRSMGDKVTFAAQLELPDATRRIMRVYAPVLACLTLLLAIPVSLRQGNLLRAWTAMLLAGYPLGILIAYPRPFAACSKRLFRSGAAVAGWRGAKDLSGEAGLAVEDGDLFPPDNVTLNGMKIYSDRSVAQIVGYACAVVETAGSGLVPLFQDIRQSQNGRHYSVETFRRYEGGGLGAELQGDVVLMGSLAFMRLMRVQMPQGADLKQAVYLAVNSELAAVFALHYAPDSGAQTSLHTAVRSPSLLPLLATRDFMITPLFIKHRYKLPPERIEFPSVEERARLSSPDAVREPKQGALLARPGFSCFVTAVVGARNMRSATRGAAAVSILGGCIGVPVLFFLCLMGTGSAVSAWNLLLYSLLWLLPGLLLTWQGLRA